MDYTNKTVSCREILAKVQRTFKPQGSSWIPEAIEDIGWGIQAIGYHAGFIKKSSPKPYLTVANNRVKIPCEVERIIAVEMLLPNSNAINVLNPDGTTPVPTQDDITCGNFKAIRLRLGSDLTGYGLADDDSPRTTMAQPNLPYYNLNSDYIITSFTDGLIKLHYIAFDIDKDGYPRVIDDFDYKSALEWFIYAQMIFKGYKSPSIDYKGAFQQFEMYRLRAENAVKAQSLDGATRFRNGWSRYVQNSEVEKDFFINNEQPVYISQ